MKTLRRRLLQVALPVAVGLLLVYTINQLLNGERGVFTWQLLSEQVEQLRQENTGLRAEVERLQRQVQRLKKPVDEDYMDELVRRKLPLGKEDEVIILVSPSSYAGPIKVPTPTTP